jgi:hypothetical protein
MTGRCSTLAFAAAALCCLALSPVAPAHAAFPVKPDDNALLDGRQAVFRFGFDPGERRAKVVVVDDSEEGAHQPGASVWRDTYRLESPWSLDGRIEWNMHVFPGFYTYRLCSVGDATDPSDECDLQPEIRSVRVAEGNLRPCRGEFAYGFFRNLAQRRAGCGAAAAVVRAWVKKSRFGHRGPPTRLRVGRWACRLRVFETEENPYGQLTCTRGRRVVRVYGLS